MKKNNVKTNKINMINRHASEERCISDLLIILKEDFPDWRFIAYTNKVKVKKGKEV